MTERTHRAGDQDLVLSCDPGIGCDCLSGCRVLVAEDNVILSMHLCNLLEDAGAEILGPYPYVEEALDALDARDACDIALLDFELATGTSGPIADRLSDLSVPFAFFTSKDADELLPWSQKAEIVGKPNSDEAVLTAMERIKPPTRRN